MKKYVLIMFFILLSSTSVCAEPSLLWRETFDKPIVKTSVLSGHEISTDKRTEFSLKAVMTEGGVYILDDQGKITKEIPLNDYEKTAISTDGKIVATMKDAKVSILEINNQIQSATTVSDPQALILPQSGLFELSPQGRYLVLAPYFGRKIYFYNQQGQIISQHNAQDLKGAQIRFSKDGGCTVIHVPNWGEGKTNGYVLFFNDQGEKLWQFEHKGCEAKFDISFDGSCVILATEEKFYSLKRAGKVIYEKELMPGGIDVTLSGNGEYAVINRRAEHSITLLDNKSGKELWTYNITGFDPINSPFTSLDISETGEFIAVTLSKDWTKKNKESLLYIFDNAGNIVWQKAFEEYKIEAHLSPDGRCIEVIAGKEVYLYSLH
jgi:outer membrane protein assembly factor BamB